MLSSKSYVISKMDFFKVIRSLLRRIKNAVNIYFSPKQLKDQNC